MQLNFHLNTVKKTRQLQQQQQQQNNEGQQKKSVKKVNSTVIGTRNQPISKKNGQSNNQSNHPEADRENKTENCVQPTSRTRFQTRDYLSRLLTGRQHATEMNPTDSASGFNIQYVQLSKMKKSLAGITIYLRCVLMVVCQGKAGLTGSQTFSLHLLG